LAKRRTLGFVDSVDVAARLANYLHQAEWQDLKDKDKPCKTPLYAFRYPAGRPEIDLLAEIRIALKQFCGWPDARTTGLQIQYHDPDPRDGCPRTVTRDCLQPPHHFLERCERYEAGECWFFSGQVGEEGLRPIAIQTHRSGRRAWGEATRTLNHADKELWRLLVTTSALEVGFDNPELIATWQYHAPPSVAAFVQRKGRGGRGVRDYPLTMVVLGTGARDVFCFQDHLRLVDIEAQDIMTYVDERNPSVRDQHVVSAVFDFCASEPRYTNAYYLEFERLVEALQDGKLPNWIARCFPDESPGKIGERLARLSACVRQVWHARLDLSMLEPPHRPQEDLWPKTLLEKTVVELAQLEILTRGKSRYGTSPRLACKQPDQRARRGVQRTIDRAVSQERSGFPGRRPEPTRARVHNPGAAWALRADAECPRQFRPGLRGRRTGLTLVPSRRLQDPL